MFSPGIGGVQGDNDGRCLLGFSSRLPEVITGSLLVAEPVPRDRQGFAAEIEFQ